jgi:hypothetical protein
MEGRMVSLGGMTVEQAKQWLNGLDLQLNEGKEKMLPEHDNTIPYEELFFLAADGS